jgi:hypothetical protein
VLACLSPQGGSFTKDGFDERESEKADGRCHDSFNSAVFLKGKKVKKRRRMPLCTLAQLL